MAEQTQHALGDLAARQLANTVKTNAQYGAITPRFLVRLLDWKPLEAGVLRVNRVKSNTHVDVLCGQKGEQELPETFVNYEEKPREYTLSLISTILDVQTRVSDLYSSPHEQINEQLRLAIESVKEKQELELINNEDYGLLKNVPTHQRISTRKGPPTPDDLDDLITKVWKEPSFFLAHPLAIAAFGRECTRRGVPPATVTMFGAQFLTWRGLPLIPTDKLLVNGETNPKSATGTSNILLLRVGEKKQGVVGLFQSNLPGEQTPGLSVRFMGINRSAIGSYLISLYCSAAILTDDAIAALDNVDVGNYYEYK
ncbi:family 2A encapsulin nanocompartment shell protein [Leptospira terpstrae]|uniref:Major membrane protein 1 family protein n=1 Tax=Leptospira terpstrae serovar Hualin str. LT 11-33 = ATCC 700639 TaxID=1257025 RepID=N1VTS9_9LEPT|nr:family 2A encapsulin nanocompartment shell protein [Leptospira terpstrae]EMY60410.1 major membrane protein 1 family protein [Leptospira terpstrae serovar Hualin str. LT 11-33 = ATCC 700639]